MVPAGRKGPGPFSRLPSTYSLRQQFSVFWPCKVCLNKSIHKTINIGKSDAYVTSSPPQPPTFSEQYREKTRGFLEVLAKLKTRDFLLRFAVFCLFSWKGRTCDTAGTDFIYFSGHHSLPTFSLLGIWQWINRWVESPGGSPWPYQPSYQRRLHPALARTCDEHSLQVRERGGVCWPHFPIMRQPFRKWPTSTEDKLSMDSFIDLILRVPSKRDLGENEFMKSVLGRAFICSFCAKGSGYVSLRVASCSSFHGI